MYQHTVGSIGAEDIAPGRSTCSLDNGKTIAPMLLTDSVGLTGRRGSFPPLAKHWAYQCSDAITFANVGLTDALLCHELIQFTHFFEFFCQFLFC